MTTVFIAFDNWDIIIDNEGEYQSIDAPYIVLDASNEETALEAVRAQSPKYYGVLQRTEIRTDTRVNTTTFKILVRYEGTSTNAPGANKPDTTYSFDTTGGTTHITNSYKTISKTPSTAPDFKTTIGFDGENVAGTDITTPIFQFSETHYFRYYNISQAYRKNLALLTGCYNSNSFRSFQAGEVLFLGARGARQGTKREDLWEIEFRFAVSRNRTNIKVGDLTVASKKGWDYLWVYYVQKIDSTVTPNLKISVPKYVYTEQVYQSINFGRLGI